MATNKATKIISGVDPPKTMKVNVTTAQEGGIPVVHKARRIPGVPSRNKMAEMATRAQGLNARAHAARNAATPPDNKAVMVGSQQV